MTTKADNIYPIYQDEVECTKDFRIFKKGGMYQITGFGKSVDKKNKKHDAWWISNLHNMRQCFPVKKETFRKLFDDKTLIFLDPEKKI